MRAFDPWIGPAYWAEGLNGVQLLVLGESQYVGPAARAHPFDGTPTPACRTSTQEIVRDLAIEHRNAFFTKIAKLALSVPAGVWLPTDERVRFWNRVCFYNFVQSWLENSRFRPTEDMWRRAQGPFLETVAELKPHVVLVLGHQLATWLPDGITDGVLVKVPHPSSRGFSYDAWNAPLQSALDAKRTSPRLR